MLNAKESRWRKLDNAAKIFPATSGKQDTRVFRFSCELKEQIDEKLLQRALDRTMDVYPLFRSVMRKGLFWYYLENSDLRPIVERESKPPCSMIYIHDKKSLLFEVTYFNKSIHFEVFHALTDGTGATQFLKELVKNYLLLAHKENFTNEIPLLDETITHNDKEDDSFSKYYSESGPRKSREKILSYQIRGPRTEYGELQIVEGVVCSGKLLEKAREYQVSISVLLTAVFLCAIHREMGPRQQRYPVVLMVPVNLRKYFPSASMLNFFSWINPGYLFTDEEDHFKEVLEQVKEYYEAELKKENIAVRMNELIRIEYNPVLRLAPLELKNICLQAGARLAKKDVTAIFSNMGIVSMPAEYAQYIELFHVYTSTPKIELCMCSFLDNLVLSFTSRFENLNIQRNFFRILEELGVEVVLRNQERPKEQEKELSGKKFFQWFSFLCIALSVSMFMINAVFTPASYWSVFASAGILCMCLAIAVGFYKRRNLQKNVVWQQIWITGACLIWDLFTHWKGWSVDYVFPLITIATIFSLILIAKVQQLKAVDYMIYFVMAGVSGLIPGILLLFGVLNVEYPSILCTGISFLFLTAIVIFRKKELMIELYKNFHV